MELKWPTSLSTGELSVDDSLSAARCSEFTYFKAAAVSETGPDWFIAQMPGLEHVSSASFGFWEPSGSDRDAVEATVAAIEAAFARFGACQTRFYTNDAAPALAEHLGNRGYRCREEIIALQAEAQPGHAATALELCEVASEKDWSDKLALHETSDLPSDGHRTRALDWVTLERRKAETGEVAFYLFKQSGEVVATAGLMRPSAGIIRLKNLFVSARHRRRGLGQALLAALSQRAHRRYGCCPVVYYVAGPVGQRLYTSVGFQPIGVAFEWIRKRS